MKTFIPLAALTAIMTLTSLSRADDYGWAGSSSRSHSNSGYARGNYGPMQSSAYGNSGYSNSMNLNRNPYNDNDYNRSTHYSVGAGYGSLNRTSYPTRIGVIPVTNRYNGYPTYGGGFNSYGSGYNDSYCPTDRGYSGYGAGYYGR